MGCHNLFEKIFQSRPFLFLKNIYYLIALVSLLVAGIGWLAKHFVFDSLAKWMLPEGSIEVSTKMLGWALLVFVGLLCVLAFFSVQYFRLVYTYNKYGTLNPNTKIFSRDVELHHVDGRTYVRKLSLRVFSRIHKLDRFTDRFSWSGSRDGLEVTNMVGFKSYAFNLSRAKYIYVDFIIDPPMSIGEERLCGYELKMLDSSHTFEPHITFRKYDAKMNKAKVFLPKEYVGKTIRYQKFIHTTSGIAISKHDLKFLVSEDGNCAIFSTGYVKIRPFIIHKYSWDKLD